MRLRWWVEVLPGILYKPVPLPFTLNRIFSAAETPPLTGLISYSTAATWQNFWWVFIFNHRKPAPSILYRARLWCACWLFPCVSRCKLQIQADVCYVPFAQSSSGAPPFWHTPRRPTFNYILDYAAKRRLLYVQFREFLSWKVLSKRSARLDAIFCCHLTARVWSIFFAPESFIIAFESTSQSNQFRMTVKQLLFGKLIIKKRKKSQVEQFENRIHSLRLLWNSLQNMNAWLCNSSICKGILIQKYLGSYSIAANKIALQNILTLANFNWEALIIVSFYIFILTSEGNKKNKCTPYSV